MKPLVRHLRSSGLLLWVIPLALIDVAVLFLRTRYWIGIWPEAGAAAQVPALLLGIGASGASAWVSGSRARNNLDNQLAAVQKSSAQIDLYRLGAVVTAFFLPYICGVIAAWAVTIGTNPPGMPMFFKYAAAGALALLLSCLWGWLLGKLLTGRFAAIAAILSWIIFVMAIGPRVGLSFVSGPPWQEIDAAPIVLRIAAALVFFIALLFLPSRISLGKRASVTSMGAGIASIACVVVAISSTSPVLADRIPPKEIPCTSGSIAVCYWPEHEKYVPLINTMTARASTLPKGFTLPGQVYEFDTRWQTFRIGSRVVHQPAGDFTILDGSKWSLASGLATDIGSATFPRSCNWDAASAAKDSTADELQHWVEIYLAGGGTPDYRLGDGASSGYYKARKEAEVEASSATTKQQFTWAEKKLEYFRDRYCR